MAVLSLRAAQTDAWTFVAKSSQIDFAVKATGDAFVGHLMKWDAQFRSEPGQTPTGGKLSFQIADLNTGKVSRDKQMQVWLESSQFPVATFELKQLVASGEQFAATGDFTFHGVTHSISFPVRLSQSGSLHTIDGAVTLDYRQWNLKIFHKFGLLKVDPLVKVTFHLEAVGA